MCLIMILAATVLANHSPEVAAYKSQYETILADLNQYMAKTLDLVIILMDDAIKYTCI